MDNSFWKNKKVFITGHTGFKGSWLTILLHHLGAEIYGYALDPPTEPSLFKLCALDEIIHATIGDIRDLPKLTMSLQHSEPDVVIHMAAQPIVRLSYQNPVETYGVNVMGTVNIMEATRHVPSVKALLNVTTDKCYENKEWHWGYREDDQLGGYDPYSSSKACSELVTAAYLRSFFQESERKGTAIATARAGNVIGGGDWAQDRLIPDFIRSIQQNKKIIIRSPHSIRPWQHVLEPLSGYLSLTEQLVTNGESFNGAWNFGPGDKDAKSVEWIVMKLCSLWGNDASYEVTPHPQSHEATYLKLDISKSVALLNWHPKWSLDKAISTIIDFTKSWQNKEDLRQVCVRQIEEYFGM